MNYLSPFFASLIHEKNKNRLVYCIEIINKKRHISWGYKFNYKLWSIGILTGIILIILRVGRYWLQYYVLGYSALLLSVYFALTTLKHLKRSRLHSIEIYIIFNIIITYLMDNNIVYLGSRYKYLPYTFRTTYLYNIIYIQTIVSFWSRIDHMTKRQCLHFYMIVL